MRKWSRPDRITAYIRLVRQPLSLVDVTNGTGDDFSSVSATLSKLYQDGELNRKQKLDDKGRWRYFYTDPDHCEEPTYVLTVALEAYDEAMS